MTKHCWIHAQSLELQDILWQWTTEREELQELAVIAIV